MVNICWMQPWDGDSILAYKLQMQHFHTIVLHSQSSIQTRVTTRQEVSFRVGIHPPGKQVS